jgi:hypothetical protein
MGYLIWLLASRLPLLPQMSKPGFFGLVSGNKPYPKEVNERLSGVVDASGRRIEDEHLRFPI